MNQHVDPLFAEILNNFAAIPAQVAAAQAEAQAIEADLAMLADKRAGGYAQREMANAMRLQLNMPGVY